MTTVGYGYLKIKNRPTNQNLLPQFQRCGNDLFVITNFTNNNTRTNQLITLNLEMHVQPLKILIEPPLLIFRVVWSE